MVNSVEMMAQVQTGAARRDLTLLTELGVSLHSRFMREENFGDSERLKQEWSKSLHVSFCLKE